MHILVAEDDDLSRRLLDSHLRRLGYQTTLASDGEEAWRMFNLTPFRIVVSDWLMPGLDGLELCRRLRARPNTDYTYVILLTANLAQEGALDTAMAAGVDDFLAKPLDRHQLEVRLRVAERIVRAASRIKSLETMLTVCAYTKKINLPDGGWQSIEEFLDTHLGIKASHGIAPDYYEAVIKPELQRMRDEASRG